MSCSSPRGAIICDPSIYLSKLLTSELSGIKVIPLPIYSPCHVSHIYSIGDVELLLDTLTLRVLEQTCSLVAKRCRRLIWSGKFKICSSWCIEWCFLRPMQWKSMVQELSPTLRSSKDFKAVLIPLASAAALSLQGALKSSSAVDSTIMTILPQNCDHQFSHCDDSGLGPAILQDNSRSKIASIGISGRFPDTDTTSKLWDILYKGLDTHQIVSATRWNVETHVDISGKQKNTSATPYGGWFDKAGLFNVRFFGLNGKSHRRDLAELCWITLVPLEGIILFCQRMLHL